MDNMAGSAIGALKTAAKRMGLSVEEYGAHIAAGEKWCRGCKAWHAVEAFSRDSSRGDGRKTICRAFDKQRYDATYQRVPDHLRGPYGPTPAPARDGDVRQARHRVNVLVQRGKIPRPSDLPCAECGHVWSEGERRHEYDHHLGYGPEHHLDVEPVCTTCHAMREASRGRRFRARAANGTFV